MSSVLWLNRGPLSRGSQAKRVRHRGKTAREKERDCTLEALGIDCCGVDGRRVNSSIEVR